MLKDYMNQRFYRKNIAWMYLIFLVVATIASFVIPKEEFQAADEAVVIPEEAIRLRILANSDSKTDQEVKRAIRDAVNEEITKWVEELTSIDEARTLLTSQLDEIEKIAREELQKQGLHYDLNVEFGNVQFPTKLYGHFLYPAGTYEAILITLGEGGGANWWCVLFPPLCFLDFSHSLAESPGFEEESTEEHAEVNNDNETEHASAKKEDTKAIEPNVEVAKVDKEVEREASSTNSEEETEVEVKFFLVELFNKIF